MNDELYGMQKVKEQILIFLNTKLRNSSTKGCSLGLIGSPGTGKTSIAKTIAKCLDFPFEQISFGNVSNAEFLTGHDYTYIGSRPGEIVRCLSRLGHKNGIIFMDEFDKVSEKPAIVNCLLHITDPSHNNEFKDNYLADITIDLSSIWFIYSMNNMPEDPALRDRLFVIEVEEYTVADKVEIIKNHIIPKTLKNIGLSPDSISIKEEDIKKFITSRHDLQDERGVRTLEKTIKELINKVHFIVSNKMDGVSLLDFKVSFYSNKLDKYPVVLTTDIIDKFIPIKEKNIYREMFL